MLCCNNCDKTIDIKNKSKHNRSKSQEHKDKNGAVVKENEFIRPDNNEIDSIIDNCVRD